MPQWAWFIIVLLAIVALLWLLGVQIDVNA